MLPFRDAPLNSGCQRFDISNRMSHTNNNAAAADSTERNNAPRESLPRAESKQHPDAMPPQQESHIPGELPGELPGALELPGAGAAQLAHELANLLDGSLRHLHLAIDTLSRNPSAEQMQGSGNLLNRLQTTDTAMQQMASLIRAWMKAAPKPRELFEQSQTLKHALEQIIEIHRPAATEHSITLDLHMDDTAKQLPAGPVFPVIANAVINSIEAIAAMPPRDRYEQSQIFITARVELNNVYLIVTDNGPGLSPDMVDSRGQVRIGQTTKPQGHGLGLSLSQQVATSLAGSLTLKNNPKGGATLTLKYPVAGLTRNSNQP